MGRGESANSLTRADRGRARIADPPSEGLEVLGVHALHTMADCFSLHEAIGRSGGTAVIVGAGYIGLEMAEHRE
jgi:NAD(P)H-nitrite reductase large subunit